MDNLARLNTALNVRAQFLSIRVSPLSFLKPLSVYFEFLTRREFDVHKNDNYYEIIIIIVPSSSGC